VYGQGLNGAGGSGVGINGSPGSYGIGSLYGGGGNVGGTGGYTGEVIIIWGSGKSFPSHAGI
jgi:hypothetical protein